MFAATLYRNRTTTFATCALAAFAVGAATAATSDASANVRREARVVRVLDGDRVLLKTRAGVARYRLLGVSAPALTDCFGQQSRARLSRLLPAGTRVRMIGRSRTSRSVVILLGGAGVNRLIVSSGHAEATLRDGSRLAGTLSAAQTDAHDAGRGLWSACSSGDDAQPPAQSAPARPAPQQPTAQQPAPTMQQPAPTAPPAGATTRLSAAQFQALIENSVLTRVTNSDGFGGSSNRNDFTFCTRGRYGFHSESFNNGFVSSGSETGSWRIVSLTRNAQLQADEATLELITQDSDASGFDPSSPASGRTFRALIQAFGDGSVRLGGQPTQKTAATGCPA